MAITQNPPRAFIWGANGVALTPEEIARRRQIEDALVAKGGIDASPVGHWSEGLARVLDAAGGAYRRSKLNQAAGETRTLGNENFNKILNALNGQQDGATSGVPMSDAGAEVAATSPAAGGDAQSYRDAIASIESAGSGDYGAVGPRHPKMGRALGRYQVMESNIGPWSMEALGREVTPDEFMADPAIQDAIFDSQFGKYVQKYGPEGAAQAWFGGEGGVGKLGRKDVLGTSIGGYGKKFLNALGGREVASLDPSSAIAEGAIVPGAEPIVPMEGEGTPTATTGRDAIAQAMAAQEGQQAIADQAAGMPVTGQAAQSDGIMQAVNGTNAGGVFGLNPMQEQSAREYAQANILQDPAFIEAMSSPYLSDQQRAIAQTMVEQRMRQQEAARRQQAERDNWLFQKKYEEEQQARDPYRQAQIEALRRKGQNLINAGDGRLYDPEAKEWIVAPTGTEGKGFRFGGTSVEAQSLNGLMDSGALTPEQAQQLGAGKTISGPNGEIIFMTPQGVFGSTPDGQTQKLSGDMPDAGAIDKGSRGGNITLTEPKVTLDERRAMGFADRMDASGKLLNQHEQAGLGVKDQFVRGNDWIPDFAENWLVSEDFQKFDQARRDFINAQLRRESGAVISDEEFDNANKQYFPQPGDTPEVIAQKRANRDVVIKSMARDAGPTYGGETADPLAQARKAIAAGANREAVIKRLRENGIDPGGL